jgi:hypothetical protein
VIAALLAFAIGAPAAIHAAPAQQSFAGIMAATDSCLAAAKLHELDAPRLARDGWNEVPIENVDKAPHPYRLFRKDGSGAVMMVNFGDDDTPHCHVMVVRPSGSVDMIAGALTEHLGAPFLPGDQGLGEGARAMRVPGGRAILVLRSLGDDKNFMAEIHIMPIGEDQ